MDDNMKAGIKGFVRANFMYAIVFLACAVYVLRGLVDIVETGKTVRQIIGSGAVTTAFGWMIMRMFSVNGLLRGSADPRVIATNRLHGETVTAASSRFGALEQFCRDKTDRKRREMQTHILAAACVSYDDFLSGRYHLFNGDLILLVPEEELPKAKKKAVKAARDVRITPLTSSALTSVAAKERDPFRFGGDKAAYERSKSVKNIATSLAFGVLFGYYTFNRMDGGVLATVMWAALQSVLFLASGAIQQFLSYIYVTENCRAVTIRKIDILQEFLSAPEPAKKEEAANGNNG